jgi:hypothetical protein
MNMKSSNETTSRWLKSGPNNGGMKKYMAVAEDKANASIPGQKPAARVATMMAG